MKWASCGRREHVWAVTAFLPLLLQNTYRIRRQRQGAVGVLRLQWGFDDLSIDPCDLPLDPEAALRQINIFPSQPQQFTSPKACRQFNVVQLEDTALLRFPQEGCQLFYWQSFHFLMFQLWQGTAVCWIAADELLIFGKIHRGGNHLVDSPHGLDAQSFGLAF